MDLVSDPEAVGVVGRPHGKGGRRRACVTRKMCLTQISRMCLKNWFALILSGSASTHKSCFLHTSFMQKRLLIRIYQQFDFELSKKILDINKLVFLPTLEFRWTVLISHFDCVNSQAHTAVRMGFLHGSAGFSPARVRGLACGDIGTTASAPDCLLYLR